MLAELHTDFPERFEHRRRLWGLAPDGSRCELQLEEHWFHKGGVVLKFAGVDSIGDAERLARSELQIPLEERAELEKGQAFVSEVVGCEIWVLREDGRQLLGTVRDVQFGAGEAPLLVIRHVGHENEEPTLLPYAEEFVTSSSLKRKRVEMRLPEGLLQLNAPLSGEEKQRQKAEAQAVRATGATRKPRRR